VKEGYLSQYFKGIAVKTLSAVEADVTKSHQHEFNGAAPLKRIFSTERNKFEANFIYLNDNDDEPVTDKGYLTWYDARESHPTRTEYRMYFPTTAVSVCTTAGDTLFIGLRPDNTVLVVITENGSTIGNQVRWLFGVENALFPSFSIREELESEQDRIAFASRFILEELGIEVEENAPNYLDEMLHIFNGNFPSTKEFSLYARSTIKDLDPRVDPSDIVLMGWMEREEILFRTLEKYLIADRLTAGFSDDVDGFINFSLSIQNRRKSRVGHALENHIEQILICRNVSYDRTKITENKSKPDFIFPSIAKYRNPRFDETLLTMLGVKSTCKDRWRQVLTEADRVKRKHLLTLEAAISENQTNEMMYNELQLVVPSSLHKTYSLSQQQWLVTMDDFISMVVERQKVG
jgi:hypothetical protein